MKSKYNYIDTIEKIQELDRYLMNPDGTRKFSKIAVDTETNGLLIYRNAMVGFSLSVDADHGAYIPLVEWIPNESSLKTRTINKTKYDSFMDGHFKCVWTGKIYPEFFTPADYEMHELLPAIIYRWFFGADLIFHNAPFDVNMIFVMMGIDLTSSVFLDTALLSHIINENSLNGLKETASEWKTELGFNPFQDAAQERNELGLSIIKNGGSVTKSGKPKTIWRAEPYFMGKYACSDTFLTMGVFNVGIQKYIDNFGVDALSWIFDEEVMPVCKEVVIPMKRRGVYLDIPYFEKIEKETLSKKLGLEDDIINEITPLLGDFDKGKSLDEAVSKQRLVKEIIKLEGLSIPTKYDKKTDKHKETLAKGVVKKVYQEDPHWIWGYIIGEDEIKYSDEKLLGIKNRLYQEVEKRRYRFNIGSDAHLRWLFCDKLGFSKIDLPQTDGATKANPTPSVKAEVLEEFMLPKFPWVSKLLSYKRLRKLHSSYILPALNLNINGWLYMDMRQNGTVSGRFACSGGFNLQTLPKVEEIDTCPKCNSKNVQFNQYIELMATRTCSDCGNADDVVTPSAIKKGFIAPPGYKIVNADYSSLEPRCFAFMSGDDGLKEVYWKNLDLYSKVYCDMFDINNEYSAHPDDDNFLKKLNKPARTDTKPIVLGIPYGSKAYQVAIMCNKYVDRLDKKTGKVNKVPDEAYGQWVIDKYLSTYPDLHKYMEKMELECVTKGYVESLFGRRRHFEYAPIIYKFLRTKNLTHNDLIDCKPWILQGPNINSPSNLGNQMNFKEDELVDLIKELGLDYANCAAKGFWKYVRSCLKNDLNNAKNWPIQCLAGHITNRGMLDTTRHYKDNNINGWVCLQIHDELMAYVEIDQSEKGATYMKVGMEDNAFAKKIDIKMIADPAICDSIKEAK